MCSSTLQTYLPVTSAPGQVAVQFPIGCNAVENPAGTTLVKLVLASTKQQFIANKPKVPPFQSFWKSRKTLLGPIYFYCVQNMAIKLSTSYNQH